MFRLIVQSHLPDIKEITLYFHINIQPSPSGEREHNMQVDWMIPGNTLVLSKKAQTTKAGNSINTRCKHIRKPSLVKQNTTIFPAHET
ncbi:MAG: hypothetical protein D3910_04315 [Candidatus Electrothrix sp. ATG2]|nr:hypothetical protein [Candidatus Electrothrix sp. ATG2]